MSAHIGFDRDDFEMVENEHLAKRPTEQEIRENIKSLGEARKMRAERLVTCQKCGQQTDSFFKTCEWCWDLRH
jgi:hypothetical protein